MTKSEEILKNTEARYIVEENKGQSKVAIYYHEEDVEKAISQSLTLTNVSQQRELLLAFVNYIDLNNKKLGGKKTLDLVDYFIAINCG